MPSSAPPLPAPQRERARENARLHQLKLVGNDCSSGHTPKERHRWDAPHRERAVIPPPRTDSLRPCSPQLPLGNPGTTALFPTPGVHCNLVLFPEKPGLSREPFTPTAASVHNSWARKQARVGLRVSSFFTPCIVQMSKLRPKEDMRLLQGHGGRGLF